MKKLLLIAIALLSPLALQAKDYAVGTTSESITFPLPTKSVVVVNDHASATLYVNFKGSTALNRAATDATTTASSAVVDLGTDAATLGIKVGDLIELDEGNSNDGLYSIVAVSGDDITLSATLPTAVAGTQDYEINSVEVKAGESYTFNGNAKTLAFIGSGAATTFRVEVVYE